MTPPVAALSLGAPFWFTRPWYVELGEERVCEVLGLDSTDGRGWGDEEQNTTALVDATIAPLILHLNQIGMPTAFCCSGVDEDHRLHPGTKIDLDDTEKWQRGYLYFATERTHGAVPTRRAADLAPLMPELLHMESYHRERGDVDRISFARKCSNAQRVAAWLELETNVKGTYPLSSS